MEAKDKNVNERKVVEKAVRKERNLRRKKTRKKRKPQQQQQQS